MNHQNRYTQQKVMSQSIHIKNTVELGTTSFFDVSYI